MKTIVRFLGVILSVFLIAMPITQSLLWRAVPDSFKSKPTGMVDEFGRVGIDWTGIEVGWNGSLALLAFALAAVAFACLALNEDKN
jgi:hypothetical protein